MLLAMVLMSLAISFEDTPAPTSRTFYTVGISSAIEYGTANLPDPCNYLHIDMTWSG